MICYDSEDTTRWGFYWVAGPNNYAEPPSPPFANSKNYFQSVFTCRCMQVITGQNDIVKIRIKLPMEVSYEPSIKAMGLWPVEQGVDAGEFVDFFSQPGWSISEGNFEVFLENKEYYLCLFMSDVPEDWYDENGKIISSVPEEDAVICGWSHPKSTLTISPNGLSGMVSPKQVTSISNLRQLYIDETGYLCIVSP